MKKSKLLALLLVVCMVFAMMPAMTVFADASYGMTLADVSGTPCADVSVCNLYANIQYVINNLNYDSSLLATLESNSIANGTTRLQEFIDYALHIHASNVAVNSDGSITCVEHGTVLATIASTSLAWWNSAASPVAVDLTDVKAALEAPENVCFCVNVCEEGGTPIGMVTVRGHDDVVSFVNALTGVSSVEYDADNYSWFIRGNSAAGYCRYQVIMLGSHRYNDGVCDNCSGEDPNYVAPPPTGNTNITCIAGHTAHLRIDSVIGTEYQCYSYMPGTVVYFTYVDQSADPSRGIFLSDIAVGDWLYLVEERSVEVPGGSANVPVWDKCSGGHADPNATAEELAAAKAAAFAEIDSVIAALPANIKNGVYKGAPSYINSAATVKEVELQKMRSSNEIGFAIRFVESIDEFAAITAGTTFKGVENGYYGQIFGGSNPSIVLTEPTTKATTELSLYELSYITYRSDVDAWVLFGEDAVVTFNMNGDTVSNVVVVMNEGVASADKVFAGEYLPVAAIPVPNTDLKSEAVAIPAAGQTLDITSSVKNDMPVALSGDIAKALNVTEEEKAQGVWMWMELDTETVDKAPATDVNLISKAVPNGYTVATYLGIDIYKQVVGGDKVRVSETNGPITVSIEVPSYLRSTGRTFAIIYTHDGGEAKVIQPKSYDPNTGILVFEANLFSTYALAYQGGYVGGGIGAPATGDTTHVGLLLAVMALSLGGIAVVVNKKRRFEK